MLNPACIERADRRQCEKANLGLEKLGSFKEISPVDKFDRITFDPRIMGGRACIRGMRLPVSVIVGQIAHGASMDEILADYPDLEVADVQEALEYSAWLAEEGVVPG